MFKTYGNRIIDNQIEMYKNKLLFVALTKAKPITNSTWALNKLPSIKKNTLTKLKDRARSKEFINIARENCVFFKKLQKCKTSYSIDKYKNEYIKNKKYSDNIRKCKNVSVSKYNNIYRCYYNNKNLAFNFCKKDFSFHH